MNQPFLFTLEISQCVMLQINVGVHGVNNSEEGVINPGITNLQTTTAY